MIVIRRYMHNPLANFNYLLGCEQSRQAIVIDPFDAKLMLKTAAEHQLDIKMIINTHEHFDHVMGNAAIQEATGAEVWAKGGANVPKQTHNIEAGDVITLGTIRLQALHTPGHTSAHVCLLSDGAPTMLFSGDTLFNASAGNCKNGGNVDDLYETFVEQLLPLPDETLLYPGHDYMKTNLQFALDREPNNQMAAYWVDQVQAINPENMPVMTLGQERQYNPFLRLQEQNIRARLKEQFPKMEDTDRAVFKALRQLRDNW